MKVVSEPLQSGSSLADDYIHHYEKVSPLYGEDHHHDQTWMDRMQWLDDTEDRRVNRHALVEILKDYNGKFNSHDAVHTSLYMLEKPETLVVTGGQQSGLFTGSMLVVYKAITIIQTAKEAEKRLNRPVVPVFWIAGEDHDWDEVNHTYFLSGDPQQVSKIKMDKYSSQRSSVSYSAISSDEWDRAIQSLSDTLPDSDVKADILTKIQQSADTSDNLSDAFAKLMGDIFGKYGLVLLDSSDARLRKLESPVFASMIERNDDLGQAYRASADQITSLGYGLQADVADDGANLFYIHEGNRLLLAKQDGKFMDRKGLVSFTKEQLLEMLEMHPERFSNNVLTRPIMQDSLLPVLACVLGQGEIAYWAITRQAFEIMDAKMPILLPRMSFTLIEDTQQKYMEKYGLSFQDVQYRLQERREQWLSAQDSLQIDKLFTTTREAFEQLYDPLIEQLGNLQTGLYTLGQSNKNKITDQIAYLEGKAKDALEQQHEATLRQWDRIGTLLFPMGKPQERVFNVYHYMNRYGLSLIEDILEKTGDYSEDHRVILL
ncbi:bacillithiol biosynthesis cysteine-adding enzyme BshC [Paenibacillus macquariensis]|uniref:Putative cysteine ligase BshC n=1 Tax=Paenibacillus macquariensis TaxID=948756 RepID=A0ABY1K0W8_9BACL|nr:bacillithiol biosynthesis cysteine-adding enzyme BshC [Paenibacillus macquariensis]MEC0091908.1 bacillithiol biosynthesis cysteine-adding enzyme BshC [Paenibacillus macquariensis]OAB32191.1 bacillithiol biosynthesis cysteine-adding enzyme BshC [Paenibacillus macquariensis subsp. macquariensis]SIR09955.1 bacillithiol biosynthesis cysteine-adding enzyme BshC [Paenibacillus macquariensis]